jgi:hypothetical protein
MSIGRGLRRRGRKDDLFEYKPDNHGAEDYLMLCKEIMGREE